MTEAAATTTAPETKPVVVKDVKNGISRPTDLTTGTGRVWAIADTISGALGSPAPRANVMEQAKAEGMNLATVATQYGKWRTYNGLKGTAPIRVEKPVVEKAPKAPKALKVPKAPKATATTVAANPAAAAEAGTATVE